MKAKGLYVLVNKYTG